MTSRPPEASEGHPNLITGTRQLSTAPPGNVSMGPPTTTALSLEEEMSQKALADINSIRNFRNMQRSARRINGDMNVSNDEDLLSKQQLTDTFAILSKCIPMNPTNSSVPSNPAGPTATITVPSTPALPTPDITQPSLLSIPGTSSKLLSTNTNATATPHTVMIDATILFQVIYVQRN
ncbi:hypothetical protein JB92DRAFT_3123020 [Gautieria morchelliformis]|nr:hypothetical protein JB92DRAFT_3123020 [Gautieria morchelliformis]